MTTPPLPAASLLGAAAMTAPRQPSASLAAGTLPSLDATGLTGLSADTAQLLDSVNALQSLAGQLSGSGGASTGTFQPTIPPYKPIDQIDQRTIRDSIPGGDDGASAAGGA